MMRLLKGDFSVALLSVLLIIVVGCSGCSPATSSEQPHNPDDSVESNQTIEWDSGNFVSLLRSKDITMTTDTSIEEIVFRIIPDEEDRVEALQTGQIDITTGLSISATHHLDEDENLVLARMPARSVKVLAFNHARPPFDDVRVREGICHGLDRQSLIDSVWPGAAMIANGEFSSRSPFYIDLPDYCSHGIEKARDLLGQAGYIQGIDTTMTVPDDEDYVRLANEIARQLGEFGVRVEIQTVDWMVFLNQVYFGREFDLTVMTHKERTNPINTLSRYATASPWNYLNYSSSDYDNLLQQAAEPGTENISEILAELQRIQAKDAMVVYLASPLTTTAMNKSIKNCQFLPDGSCDLRLIRKNLEETEKR